MNCAETTSSTRLNAVTVEGWPRASLLEPSTVVTRASAIAEAA